MALELEVKCSVCFESLEVAMRLKDYTHILVVAPCDSCTSNRYHEGYQEGEIQGRAEGITEGRDQGWLIRDEEIREDLRAAIRLTQEVCAESKDQDAKTPDSSS